MIYSVVGSNYGDEGKGLATDYLALHSERPLVVRHNGGAQSGHTVEVGDKRFVFHELSSGSMRGSDTYWAKTFYPDMYKLADEIEEYLSVVANDVKEERLITIYASPETNITTIDDVLLNMLMETSRGEGRHGSCGMGIWEASLRTKAGYTITMDYLSGVTTNDLIDRLKTIREEYVIPRIKSLGLDLAIDKDIDDLLSNDDVLINFAERVIDNMKYVKLQPMTKEFLGKYSDVIFETGQGLCLDAENKKSLPHVTGSRTGITNPVKLLGEIGLKLDEVIYVTRSYLTKHGAGPLVNEDSKLRELIKSNDLTNIHNKWQGTIRYARFDSIDWILDNIREDVNNNRFEGKTSLFVTHLNETNGKIFCKDSEKDIETFIGEQSVFDKVYVSYSRYAEDVEGRG